MMYWNTQLRAACLAATVFGAGASLAHAGPLPVGESIVTVGYVSSAQAVHFSGNRNFLGTSPGSATNLADAPNIRVFQSANLYGRRLNVLLQTPDPVAQQEVLGLDETLISHNFFKINNSAEYFPGVAHDGSVTVRVDEITFNEPVIVDESTALLHVFWDVNQSRLLDHPYHHPHNAHTLTEEFRNSDEFFAVDEFMNNPPHQVFGDLSGRLQILGSGTNELTLLATIPYSLLQHLDEQNHHVPMGLPAPHGFLEPFHFHIEYVVSAVPEPATLGLLTLGALIVGRNRRYFGHRG